MISRAKAIALRRLIEKASARLDDESALDGIELFPAWKVGTLYEVKDGVKPRIQYEGKLYRVEQTHTSQADWLPDSTPALYSEIAKPGQGDTPDNPIPYNNNMILELGKYYSQDGVTYVCIRDSLIPLHNTLVELVNLYVQVYQP